MCKSRSLRGKPIRSEGVPHSRASSEAPACALRGTADPLGDAGPIVRHVCCSIEKLTCLCVRHSGAERRGSMNSNVAQCTQHMCPLLGRRECPCTKAVSGGLRQECEPPMCFDYSLHLVDINSCPTNRSAGNLIGLLHALVALVNPRSASSRRRRSRATLRRLP